MAETSDVVCSANTVSAYIGSDPWTREKARADKLWSALAGLLDDTQHAEHTCHDDPSCPVDAARRILEECR